MKEIEIYDKDSGWENTNIFESYEIAALQMAGVPDDSITTLHPNVNFNEEKIDAQFGKHTFATFNERKRMALTRLKKFWLRDTEGLLMNLVRENNALYWVETSATLSVVFKKVGGVPVPSSMVKYLLNDEMVIPALDGYRYLHEDQETASNGAWKTMYLLPSLINYMSDYRELQIHAIPREYLNTVTDSEGVVFDETKRRIVGIRKESFNCESYCVPDTVEYIDDDVFWGQKGLKHIDLGHVRMLGCNMFLQSGITELTVPESVEYVGGCLCEGCKSLTKVEFKNSMEYIDIASFNGCMALTEVILPKDLIGLSDNVFANTTSLKHITLPETLRYIGGECFMNTGLESICLPESVMEVAEDAFLGREDIEAHVEFAPDYNNLPVSLLRNMPMPAWMYIERFQESWIKQLLNNYARIVASGMTGQRKHMLNYYKSELTRCLKWIHSVEILPEFPYYTLTTALTTKDVSSYESIFLYMVVELSFVREDWCVSPLHKLSIALSFRSQLEKMYELIEDGTDVDIDSFVSTLASIPEVSSDDVASFITECRKYMQNGEEMINILLTSAWTDGPSLTTTSSMLQHLIDELK